MDKKIALSAMIIMMGFVFLAGAWAQSGSSARSFNGVITRVDPVNHVISIRNGNTESLFQVNGATQVTGRLMERGMATPKDLRPGMLVSVLYREGDQTRVADVIKIEQGSQTSQGQEYPFTCGNQVC